MATCDQCGLAIPTYQNGAVPSGYVSPEIWKVEQVSVAGIPGYEQIHKTLCDQCYRDAFARAYPGAECQLPREPQPWESPSSLAPVPPLPEPAGRSYVTDVT